jgi:hypothetical protein
VALALVSLVAMATPYRLPKEERPTTKQPKNRLLSLVVLPEGATRMQLALNFDLVILLRSVSFRWLFFVRSFRNQNSNSETVFVFLSLPWGFVLFRDKNMDNHLKVFYN